jgi:hypothetical protein
MNFVRMQAQTFLFACGPAWARASKHDDEDKYG